MTFASAATQILIEQLNSSEKRELAHYLLSNKERDRDSDTMRPYGFYPFINKLAYALEIDAEADHENTISGAVNG